MYDATDYAANLRQVPLVAYSGEKDRQIQAALVMERALRTEGLTLDHVIGPGVEHKYEPGAKREVARRVDALMSTPSPDLPALDLTTHTLRFPAGEGSVWARFEGLKQHWERARLRARVEAGNVVVVDTMGVTAFSLRRPPGVEDSSFTVVADGQRILVAAKDASSDRWRFGQQEGRWHLEGGRAKAAGKRPGLQGPIDDAFLDAFIVVVPTGAMSGPVDAWVDRQWRQFTNDWRGQFRGECRVVKDVDVTADELRDRHVVVWGTAKSNRLLARMARNLPLRWEGEVVRHGKREVARGNVVPVLIAPNPLSPDRYVVVNSGHTFASWDGTNARQTPRLPDWAVLSLGDDGGSRVVEAGFFDEAWR
jgi:hypothetical protein